MGRLGSLRDNLLTLRDGFSGAGVSYQVFIPCGGGLVFFLLTLILFKNFQALLNPQMFLS